MKPSRKYAIAFTLALTIYASPTLAIGKRDISITTAENGVHLSLSKGYGVVLNLSTIGQTVSTAWLSDPSQITMASNKGPCTGDACAGSSVLFLKPIDKLNFPGLPSASDGASLLSVITNSGQVLQFKLAVTPSIPSYTNVSVIPPLQPIAPSQPAQTTQASISRPPQRPVVPPVQPEIVINIPKTDIDDIKSLALLEQKKEADSQDVPVDNVDEDKPTSELSDREDASEEEPSPESSQVEDMPKEEATPEPKQVEETKEDSTSESEPSQETPPIVIPKSLQTHTAKEESSETVKPNQKGDVVAVLEPEVQQPRTNQDLALALLRGLHSPRGRAEVSRRSSHYRRAQDVIYLLKKNPNLSLDEAIAQVQMDETVAKMLIGYGEQ